VPVAGAGAGAGAGGGPEHRRVGAPPVDQRREAGHRQHPGAGAAVEGEEVAGALLDTDRVRPRLGDEQADQLADEDEQDAVVEHREAAFGSFDSYTWEERVVQPNRS
jgi:hypothetical protein